jgi:hypothetical protein
MSLFQSRTVNCPACGTPKVADIFYSINADRRPDLRAEVIERTLQVQVCDACQSDFRIEPEFVYLDMGRSQWLAVHPFGDMGKWETIVPADQAAFDKSYGPSSSPGAQEIGKDLAVRVAFGWAAFREKLIIQQASLDDVEVELLKLAILRQQNNAPLSQTVEMRVVDVVDDHLVVAWLDAVADTVVETMIVPLDAYETIAQDTDGWAELRSDIRTNAFQDMQRMMM